MEAVKNKTRGFTIAEMLIALAVMAILLTAVAVAFNASAINCDENQNIFEAINTGRQAMQRMTTQIRTATAISPTETSGITTQCSLVTADNKSIQFWFSSAEKKIFLSYLDAGGNRIEPAYLLCRNVTAMTFNRTVVGGEVKNVQMSMTITVDGQIQSITGAAVVRKAL